MGQRITDVERSAQVPMIASIVPMLILPTGVAGVINADVDPE